MKAVKRLEIIVNSPDLEEVIEVLEQLKIAGYTIIKEVVGKGERGIQDGDGLTNVFTNAYILVACEEKQLATLLTPLQELLEEVGGVCLVSDAYWLIN
ncbi:MAG: P-II family nitrogen regulator [Thermonemataceae bacterium]